MIHQRGFMVISFVIAISLAMIGLLTSLARLASEQMVLMVQIDGRRRADEIALDCIYMTARVLMVQRSVSGLHLKKTPVMDGFCTINQLDETPIYDTSGLIIIGTRATFIAFADSGDISGVRDLYFHSKIRAEIRVINDRVDLIRI